jgi:hypothetical protein
VKSHLGLKTPIAHDKACDMVKLIESDYGDKMVVFLLKIELLLTAQSFDSSELCNGKFTGHILAYHPHRSSASSNDAGYCAQRHQLQDNHAPHT